MYEAEIQKLKFDDRGLIPAIVQDAQTHEVLMMAKRLKKIYSEQNINIYRTSSNVTKTLEIPLYNRI